MRETVPPKMLRAQTLPEAVGHVRHARADVDRALDDTRLRVDAPHRAVIRSRRPDRACADRDRAERVGGDADPLVDRGRRRIDAGERRVEAEGPHALVAGGHGAGVEQAFAVDTSFVPGSTSETLASGLTAQMASGVTAMWSCCRLLLKPPRWGCVTAARTAVVLGSTRTMLVATGPMNCARVRLPVAHPQRAGARREVESAHRRSRTS